MADITNSDSQDALPEATDIESFPNHSHAADGAAKDIESSMQPPTNHYPPPPNGGSKAWLQVLGAWFLWFATWGVILSFGLFQKYYQDTYLRNYTPSDIAWIGTIQGCLAFFMAVISGPLFDKGYLRSLLIVGMIIITVGLMTASVARNFYSIFLSLGLCTGLGMGLVWVPGISAVATYFTTKRPLAGGLAATGAGFGNVIYSASFRPLVSAVGFGWAMRVIAFISLASMLLAIFILEQRPSPNKPRKLIDWPAFREPRFNLFAAAQFFLLAGAYVPFYFLAVYAEEKVSMSDKLSYNMLSILGAGSVFGRMFLGMAAVRYGVFQVLVMVCLISGMLTFIWGSVYNVGGVVSFAFFYGFFSGGIAGLLPIAVQNISPLHLIGTRSGMTLVFDAIGVLVGNPIAGAILNSESQFHGVQAFGGAFLLFGAFLIFLTMEEVQRHEKREAAKKTGESEETGRYDHEETPKDKGSEDIR